MNEWKNKFSNLRNQFMSRSGERLEALRKMIEYLASNPGDMNLLCEIRQQFHWCAGSGGVYGFEAVSKYGLKGEQICDQFLNQGKPLERPDAQQLSQLVELIFAAIEGSDASIDAAVPLGPVDGHAPLPPHDKPLLLIVDSNQVNLQTLSKKMSESGVHIQYVNTGLAAKEFIMKRLPDSMIITLPLQAGNAYELCMLVRSLPGGERPPIVFLAQQAQFVDKVSAIRSGGDALYEQPFDEEEVLAKIEHLMERDRPEKFKILSVEDDPDQAEYIKLTLESAGYNVLSVQDPTKFEEAFLQFEPDLVLLDVVLGPMTGFELAQYIRQNDRYAALPVVFLTTENALDMHIRSARIGGDDHLIKPIAPQLLAAAVAGRLERARTLKKLIDRDGLSGCLNYGVFMDKARDLARPDSHRFSLTLLYFDIDSMHIINDRFGYAVGDKVIGALGRLLNKAFRNASIIGRVKGDRFAVILENLDDPQVEKIARQVIGEFGNIQQYSSGNAFRSTISAAYSSYQNNMDIKTWCASTEKMLMDAKENGGNQVVTSNDWSGVRR
ncbi:MAG: response regulator [Candidatus Obscuribacterales bacterium]|jgi:diguanylate cyclase (GGDEF)-like protein|nr:response regulator [Candidatus Obscuribacterales bacterium]